MFSNILVLCYANICRSPIAHALLKHHYPHLNIDSAGIKGLDGYPIHELSKKVLEEKIHCDFSTHRSKPMTQSLLRHSDLVLTMGLEQVKQVTLFAPWSTGRVFSITHWTHNDDVSDPIGKDYNAFLNVFNVLEEAVLSWKPYLLQTK